MGLTETQLDDSEEVIKAMRNRCNAGRNCHVWRHKFAFSMQREHQRVDDWLCELRDLARKSEFETDCCAKYTPTRILGKIVIGVQSNTVRVDLLKKGTALTLDDALATVRTAEASAHQAANLRQGETATIQRVESAYKKIKNLLTTRGKKALDQRKDLKEKVASGADHREVVRGTLAQQKVKNARNVVNSTTLKTPAGQLQSLSKEYQCRNLHL